jgi:hypothetical protein
MHLQASSVRRHFAGRTFLQIALAGVALALAAIVIVVAVDYLNARWSRLAEIFSHGLMPPTARPGPHWNVNASAGRQGPPSGVAADKHPAYR